MSFREKIFIQQLAKDAKVTLDRILRKRRHTLWGETPILFRVRKYKIAGEFRSQRVTVVKPELHKIKLFSRLLGKQIELQTTPQMLRYIEASGGLDDYLLKTPDEKLMSDVASQLKVQVLQAQQQLNASGGQVAQNQDTATPTPAPQEAQQGPEDAHKSAEGVARVKQLRDELAAARTERITRMLQAASTVPDSGLDLLLKSVQGGISTSASRPAQPQGPSETS